MKHQSNDRDEVARRVAEKYELNFCECNECVRNPDGPRFVKGPAMREKLLDALISSEQRVAQLADEVGKALVEASLSPGESLTDPGEHSIVNVMHKLRIRAEAAEQRVEELEEALRSALKWMKDLADSGDAGSFEAKDIDEWVRGESALKVDR